MISESVLARVAGLPIEVWLAGSAPELFEQLRSFTRRLDEYRASTRSLAERLGNEVVPRPDLSAADRAVVLRVRRALHGCERIPATELARMALLTAGASAELAEELRRIGRAQQQLQSAEELVGQQLITEDTRVRSTAWQLLLDNQDALHAVRLANPDAIADIERRLAEGESWDTKRMRQRADYLWRMITRGTARATPRSWFGQLALLELGPVDDGPLVQLADEIAWHWTDNIFDCGPGDAGSAQAGELKPTDLLTLSPIHRQDSDVLEFWTSGQPAADRLREVRLRLTAPLAAIRHALAAGPLTCAELTARLDPEGRAGENVRGLLQYLLRVGALTAFRRPASSSARWQRAKLLPEVPAGGFLDVYRRPAAPVSESRIQDLAALARQATRLLRLIDDDGEPAAVDLLVGEEPMPLLEVVAADLDRQAATGGRPEEHRHDWPERYGAMAESGYGRLVRWLTPMLDRDDSIDLDQAPMLAEVADAGLDWPVDCLLRPIAGPTARAVLDRLEPAGVLDARFAAMLAQLTEAGEARLARHRAYLRSVEELAGGRFVEVLIPPSARHAANAVRRPGYTDWWTGDQNLDHYIEQGQRPHRYLPLSEITLRRTDGRLEARAFDELIWPIYHSTRWAARPWDLISSWLLRASPCPPRAGWRPLPWSLPGWPERRSMPRLTLANGALVVSPAQWLIAASELWQPGASLLDKTLVLNRLRDRLGMPRWIAIAGGPHDDPVPCDLSSVQAIRTFDRYLRRRLRRLMVVELIPDPEQLAAHDGSGAVSCELLISLPLGPDIRPMAERTADGWRRRNGTAAAIATSTSG